MKEVYLDISMRSQMKAKKFKKNTIFRMMIQESLEPPWYYELTGGKAFLWNTFIRPTTYYWHNQQVHTAQYVNHV